MLNKDDIEQIVGKPVNLIRYKDLDNYNSINELQFPLLIHLQTNHNDGILYGHWVCICKYGNNLSFFDSYGMFPDDGLDYINPNYNILIGQDGYLSKLLINFNGNIFYNKIPLQSFNNGSETCGNYVAAYIYYYCEEFIDPDNFSKILLKYRKKGYDLDKLIVKLTNYLKQS